MNFPEYHQGCNKIFQHKAYLKIYDILMDLHAVNISPTLYLPLGKYWLHYIHHIKIPTCTLLEPSLERVQKLVIIKLHSHYQPVCSYMHPNLRHTRELTSLHKPLMKLVVIQGLDKLLDAPE